MTLGSRPGSIFVLIGHPVRHSLSPAIHEAAYGVLGVTNSRYVAVDCADEGAVRNQVDALRRGDLAGANVTVPWKRLALELSDDAHESARDVGAANVLLPVTSSGKTTIIAHNTDVRALADELARGQSGPAAALVIGDGGGALAAVAACRSLGVRRVTVAARRYRGERDASWTTATSFEALGARPVAWPPDSRVDSEFRRAALSSDLIVQSTSDGMRGATDGTSVRDVVPWNELPSTTFAYDLVYNPPVTPFLSAAKSRGLGCESGLGMLVGQAVLALELWFGRRPDPSALREAAERTLAEKFPA